MMLLDDRIEKAACLVCNYRLDGWNGISLRSCLAPDAGRWMSPLKVHIIPKIGKYPIEEVDEHVLKGQLPAGPCLTGVGTEGMA